MKVNRINVLINRAENKHIPNIDIPIIRIKTSKEYYSYSMYKAAVNNQYKEVIK